MAVSNTISTINYSGTNTGNQTCPIPFVFIESSDIVVTLIPATGASSVLVLGTQYSLAGAGNDAGGTATIFAPVPTTTTINISRDVPATQLTSFVTADRFPAKTIERAFDKATMLVQQFLRASNRTLRFGAASPEQPELAPVPPSGQYVLGTSGGVVGWQTPPEVVLADNAVTTSKIANGAVTAAKLASGVALVPDGSITNAKLAPNSVTSANIAPGTIVDTDVANNSVSDAKLTATGVESGNYPYEISGIEGRNQFPVLSVTNKGRLTYAATRPVLPYTRPKGFPEITKGEVGLDHFTNGSIFIDTNNRLRVAGSNLSGRFSVGDEALSSNGGNGHFTMPYPATFSLGEYPMRVFTTNRNVFFISNTGKLYGAGDNSAGQLGRGNTTQSNVFVRVGETTLNVVTDFSVNNSGAAADTFCLAVQSDGTLWAWGKNTEGQLGLGNVTSPVLNPTQVTQVLYGATLIDTPFVEKVYAFGGTSCGFSYFIVGMQDYIMYGYGVFSTGKNTYGQLGLSDNADNNRFEFTGRYATKVFGYGGTNATQNRASIWINDRYNGLCGTGSNNSGTLGYGDTSDKNAFVPIGIGDVVSLSCTSGYAITAPLGASVAAILPDGTIRVWGNNTFGQLGIGSATASFSTPQPVPALTGLWVSKMQFTGNREEGANFYVLAAPYPIQNWSYGGNIYISGYQGRILGRGGAINANQTTLLPVGQGDFIDFCVFGRSEVSGAGNGPTMLAYNSNGELWSWGANSAWQTGTAFGANLSVPQRVVSI
jgi:alpha-tubulin suppressor-like RCC1 family protein